MPDLRSVRLPLPESGGLGLMNGLTMAFEKLKHLDYIRLSPAAQKMQRPSVTQTITVRITSARGLASRDIALDEIAMVNLGISEGDPVRFSPFQPENLVELELQPLLLDRQTFSFGPDLTLEKNSLVGRCMQKGDLVAIPSLGPAFPPFAITRTSPDSGGMVGDGTRLTLAQKGPAPEWFRLSRTTAPCWDRSPSHPRPFS
jgi:hypothetical protein